MKKYKVTDPNGNAVVIEAETPEQAYSLSRQQSKGPGFNAEAAWDTVKDTPRYLGMALNSVGHGLMDNVVAAGQLASHLGPQSFTDRYSDYMRNREAEYQQERGEYAGQIDAGRLTGNILPALATAGATSAASLGGRMLQGAGAGGLLATTTLPVDPDADNFWMRKAAQGGIGAAVGGLAPAVIEGVIKGSAAAVNSLAGAVKGIKNTLSGETAVKAIEQTLKTEFAKSGVDFGSLGAEARNAMIAEVQKALKAGQQVDPAAVNRMAAFQRTGVNPTVGQITRDPAQFALEQNLSKTELGGPLATRFNEQNAGLIQRLDDVRANTGAQGSDAYSSGQRVIEGLLGKDATRKSAIDAAYAGARDELGRASPMSASAFAEKANATLDEGMLTHYLPAEVRNLMNDVAAGKTPLNVQTATQIDQLLSSAQRAAGQGTPQSLAISKVRDALNSAPIESEVGEAAKAAFDTARGMAKNRFGVIEGNPGLKAAIGEDVAPEAFVEKFLVRGKVDDVASLMREMPLTARAEARAAVVDFIRSKALSASGGDTQTVSQSALNRALEAIGERKFKLIFAGDKEGREMLRALGNVASYIQKAPIGAGVNTSATATTLLDAMDKGSRLPLLGAVLGKPGDIARASQIANATGPVAPVTNFPPVITPEKQGLLGQWASRLSGTAGKSLPLLLGRD